MTLRIGVFARGGGGGGGQCEGEVPGRRKEDEGVWRGEEKGGRMGPEGEGARGGRWRGAREWS